MKFKLRKKQKREVRRITEYLISGGAFFWSGYATFFVLDSLVGASFAWSKIMATLVGWTVNYLLQRFWVFNNPRLAKHQIETGARYLFISFVNLFIDYGLVLGLKNIGITPYIGQFVSSGFFTVWNYLWYKFWVFPEKFPRAKRATAGRRPAARPTSRSRAVAKKVAKAPVRLAKRTA